MMKIQILLKDQSTVELDVQKEGNPPLSEMSTNIADLLNRNKFINLTFDGIGKSITINSDEVVKVTYFEVVEE